MAIPSRSRGQWWSQDQVPRVGRQRYCHLRLWWWYHLWAIYHVPSGQLLAERYAHQRHTYDYERCGVISKGHPTLPVRGLRIKTICRRLPKRMMYSEPALVPDQYMNLQRSYGIWWPSLRCMMSFSEKNFIDMFDALPTSPAMLDCEEFQMK